MKSKAAIKDHPIHPMMVNLPIGLFIGSVVCDTIGLATQNKKWNDTGLKMMVGGLLGGVAAAVPGVIDYLAVIPPQSEAAETGRKHALANLAMMGLFGANAVMRAKGGPVSLSVFMSTAACGLMGYAGWMGGDLVYRDQIGVDHLGADEVEHLTFPSGQGIPGEFVPVCRRSELKVGQMSLVVINGERIVVARLDEERFAAFSDRCTHVGGPLSDGTLVGETVMCPWHGSEFNACSGAVQCGPAKDAISTFEVRVDGENVQVKAPDVVERGALDAGSKA